MNNNNMNKDLNEEKIVIEIRDLINDIDDVKAGIEDYCQFMKDMFLSGSGRN